MLLTACGNDPEPDLIPSEPSGKPNVNTTSSINFRGSIKKESRATETAFEQGDAISVFAVTPSSDNALQGKNNYADNKKYVWQGSKFESSDPITLLGDNTDGLAYYAIYPYQSQAANIFEFSVQKDQSSHTGYTLSDLCTAYCAPTTDDTVNLEFSHRLTHIVFKFYGDVLANKELNVQLEDVFVTCQADINANTFEPIGSKGSVVMGEESTNVFQAIIVPQSVSKDDVIATITMDGAKYNLHLDSDIDLKSGKQTIFECQVEGDNIIVLNGYINPWDTEEDTRLESVVPKEILNNLDDHMPIYTGVNPPNVEGAYFIDPMATVYCEDGYEPGEIVSSEYIRFKNQDKTNNTLDFEEYTDGYYSEEDGAYLEGVGAFISGVGDKFTAFFKTEGEAIEEGYVAKVKTALVISGVKTTEGIKDLYYAFIMLEKDDPDDNLMDEGVFRVFKDGDGLSVNTEWESSKASRSETSNFLKSIFDKIKK